MGQRDQHAGSRHHARDAVQGLAAAGGRDAGRRGLLPLPLRGRQRRRRAQLVPAPVAGAGDRGPGRQPHLRRPGRLATAPRSGSQQSARGGPQGGRIPARVTENGAQKPLELILARNLLTSISTPAFLVDSDARLLFYNEAAGALLGRSFEEAGQMTAEEWTGAFGPLGEEHNPLPVDELPLTPVLREGRPGHGSYCIRSANGEEHRIEASAFPLVGPNEQESGAMILWWPESEDGGDAG